MRHHSFSVLQGVMFDGTIVSYPRRGFGGDHKYRGNCSPRFVRDYLLKFNPERGLVIDPMSGGGTTGDVCAQLGIPYRGFDLRGGFDSRRMSLREQLDAPAKAAFVHPPYADMIKYSRNVWANGTEHPADLSRHGDVDTFLSELQEVLYNVYDALDVGGTYGVLLGLWRKPGSEELIHLPARIFPYCPGTFVNEVIKAQHRTTSGSRNYGTQPYVMTTHEVFYVFRKTAGGLIGSIVNTVAIGERMQRDTWVNMVRSFARNQRRFSLTQAYRAFERHPRIRSNPSWKSSIRQSLQKLIASGDLERLGIADFLNAA